MNKLIEDLNWRYATKKFDSTKKITSEDLETLKSVLQLVTTSYGLQPLKYLIVEDPSLREELFAHSSGQQQIKDASHLLVICTYTKVEDELVDSYMSNTAISRQIELEKVLGFGQFIKTTLANLTDEEKCIWTAKQAYIALGLLLNACATLRIDATPMEGFSPQGYDEVLKLSEQNLCATLVVPIGYRHEEDSNQYLKKVRRPIDELFTTL